MTQARNTAEAQRLEQVQAIYDALNPEARRQLLQIMRDLKAQQDREAEQAAQTAEAGRA